MKKLLFPLTIVLSLIVIVIGYFSYQQRLDAIAEEAHAGGAPVPEETVGNEESGDETEEVTSTFSDGLVGGYIQETEGLDELRLTYFGSSSLTSTDGPTWPELVTEAVEEVTSPLPVTSVIEDVDTATSETIVNSNSIQAVIDSDPHILFFESLTLNDNGEVEPADSIANIEAMLAELQETLPETEIILMPTNPINSTGPYLNQIDVLNTFAEDLDGVTYVDHWDAWPETDDAELDDYVSEGSPTIEGHESWAEALLPLLIEGD
ncbi:SGNH/GDSL hydrolase family protein [Shouchella shacheensis]|uniref:SGNH/GDSL hydrolase family protein n=1 Tax=Shouchella shacheensis TaxID=1649580 RepID=UPI000740111F|nr:SGNH/GDSL hydrolase family protein [Shouchella shacheensis]